MFIFSHGTILLKNSFLNLSFLVKNCDSFFLLSTASFSLLSHSSWSNSPSRACELVHLTYWPDLSSWFFPVSKLAPSLTCTCLFSLAPLPSLSELKVRIWLLLRQKLGLLFRPVKLCLDKIWLDESEPKTSLLIIPPCEEYSLTVVLGNKEWSENFGLKKYFDGCNNKAHLRSRHCILLKYIEIYCLSLTSTVLHKNDIH